jgi:UDP-glucose 4-epimerase
MNSQNEYNLHEKRVVVFGGMGFIGANLVKELLKLGANVTVIDNCFNSTEQSFDSHSGRFEFLKESVLNDSVYSYLDVANLIFHLACIQINHSSKNPELDLSVNALSTLRILEYLRRKTPSSLERFIYTSTTSIYGSPENLPISESSKPQILNHYAASKLLAEQYVMLYNLQYNVPVTVVRYSNVYGYGQTPLNPYCGVLGKFIHNALSGLPLSVFGDGEQTRDYTFIEDAISATILAALHPKAIGDVFNIGTSIETSVNKLVSYIAEVVPTAKIVHVPERDIDNIRRRALSISKISQKLGWTPKTTIAQGVRQTIEWYKLQIK